MDNHLTLTFDKCQEASLRVLLGIWQQMATEVPSRHCISVIPGLISRSFKFEGVEVNRVQQLLNNIPPIWIKHGLRSDVDLKCKLTCKANNDFVSHISFGFLGSIHHFYSHLTMSNYFKLRTNTIHRYIAIQYPSTKPIELRLNADCLDTYIVVTKSHSTLIIPLKAIPRCYDGTGANRSMTFPAIDIQSFADTSALRLTFANEKTMNSCIAILTELFALDVHFGFVSFVPKGPYLRMPLLADFWSHYAFQMLLSLGYRIKDRLSPLLLVQIYNLSITSQHENYPNHRCYLKLVAVYHRARHNRFFDINNEFDDIEPLLPNIILHNYAYVPRIYLTPYGIHPLPVKPIRGNRILRQQDLFGPPHHFCRVIIRDIDLRSPQKDLISICYQWVENLLTQKLEIIVGNRTYHFLLCSNSQLRDRSFWFYSSYMNLMAGHIRNWMGDFSAEQCIGTFIARMALSLTGTHETIQILPHQIESIEDKLDEHGRIFTDGCGKISPSMLRKVFEVLNANLIVDDMDGEYFPCVIQARLNGIKGVFVLAPDLIDRGDLIQYRPSQHKFVVHHNKLEIVKYSILTPAYLNRQVILLLENMGVQPEIFLQLQNTARLRTTMSLLANDSAERVLERKIRCYEWERIRTSGFCLTQEPFSRSLLLFLALNRFQRLKDKSHVPIPFSAGRMLYGVVDETGSLRYGQVFIRLRDERRVVLGPILVTKNPAYFPGDILKLEAVDCPALHHLTECIVFPTEGPRPHPNEISGSDTDGDEFWACWLDSLVNNVTKRFDPALFDPPHKIKHEREITLADMAQFLIKYMISDSVGLLSNRHLANCARNGPCDNVSLQLARIISDAVDFPKTGICPEIPASVKIDQYPDFMANHHKPSFESQLALGQMYRLMKQTCEIFSSWQNEQQDEMITKKIALDPDLLLPGHENYIEQARLEYNRYCSRMNTILSMYNLENEYELITGCHSCLEEEKKNNDSVETALQEFRQLTYDMRKRFHDKDELSNREQRCKASAWYYVAYNTGTMLSFGWIMDRLLCQIKAKRSGISSAVIPEDHQALTRIGHAVRNNNCEQLLDAMASSIIDETEEIQSETARLGHRFLKLIEWSNVNGHADSITHNLLVILLRIALGIVQ